MRNLIVWRDTKTRKSCQCALHQDSVQLPQRLAIPSLFCNACGREDNLLDESAGSKAGSVPSTIRLFHFDIFWRANLAASALTISVSLVQGISFSPCLSGEDVAEVYEICVLSFRFVLLNQLNAMVPVDDKLTKPPRNAKELMATGLLEGRYVRCSCRGEQLTGILQDMGVVCNCRICKGTQVVSISAFEAHSGSTSHHPSHNIYLENGKNLRDILSAGQESADCGGDILGALKHAIGEIQGIPKKEGACGKCGKREGGDFVSCKEPKCSAVYHAECVGLPSPHRVDWFCAKCEKAQVKMPKTVLKMKRPPAVTDREDTRLKEKELTVRSARDAHLHKALFLPGGLADGTELGYYARNQCILKGVKQGGGICCKCCNQEISCSAFEQHAGCESRRNPYGSILLADGRSLKDMCKELAYQSKLGDRAHQVARTGDVKSSSGSEEQGVLASSQRCESTWCINFGTRFSCQEADSGHPLCKICQKNVEGAHKTSKKRVDATANIPATDDTGRNVRLFQAPDSSSGCAICKKWTLKKCGFDMTMLVCDQCGREYHVGCLRESGILDELPEAEWYCQPNCQHIVQVLSQLVANGPELLSDNIVNDLLESRQHQQGIVEMAESSSPVFGWQILHGAGENPVNGRTLAQAVEIFTECSDPIKDAPSGQNMIPIMVYSRRFKDYDFDGIYCVVLTLNEKVVSTALLQIFGREVAEVPLIATSVDHQDQGFCKALMTTIERLLGVLNVERLVLPASKNAEFVWVNRFGFSRMEDAQLKHIRSMMGLLVFTGTTMLVKHIDAVTLDERISLGKFDRYNDHWAAGRR
uniref:PHD-type domain-containing protein n=1 Tax=Physcomitrium patens TaxID=3218 RepID=A0A7I4EA87_PHYPA